MAVKSFSIKLSICTQHFLSLIFVIVIACSALLDAMQVPWYIFVRVDALCNDALFSAPESSTRRFHVALWARAVDHHPVRRPDLLASRLYVRLAPPSPRHRP